ncbi:hypothetical protein [Paenibacillus shirakamiensis]|nr:hypothetical protein [Paenibacillus shirakamiensis]
MYAFVPALLSFGLILLFEPSKQEHDELVRLRPPGKEASSHPPACKQNE